MKIIHLHPRDEEVRIFVYRYWGSAIEINIKPSNPVIENEGCSDYGTTKISVNEHQHEYLDKKQ